MNKMAFVIILSAALALSAVCLAFEIPERGAIDIMKAVDGSQKWVFQPAGLFIDGSSPAVGPDGTVYVGSMGGYYSGTGKGMGLYAVNPDGSEKWFFQTFWGPVVAPPAIGPDGTVYVVSSSSNWGSKVYALDPENHDVKWETDIDDLVYCSPAIGSDGTIYIASFGENSYSLSFLYALDPANGDEKWSFILGSARSVRSPVIGADGTVFVVSSNTSSLFNSSAITAVQAQDSPPTLNTHSYWTGTGIGSAFPPAIDFDGTMYFPGSDGAIHVLSHDLQLKAQFHPEIPGVVAQRCTFSSSPVIGPDGTLYIGATVFEAGTSKLYPRLFAISRQGVTRWSLDVKAYVLTPAAAADGSIVFGTLGSMFYSVEPKLTYGQIKWTRDVGLSSLCYGSDRSPAIATDGTIYYGNGSLHAIRSFSGGLAASPWPMFQQNAKHTGKAPVQYGRILWKKMVPIK